MMKASQKLSPAVDAYIAAWSKEEQAELQKIRSSIWKAVPGGEEMISYGMPTVKRLGVVMHFAVFKNHFSIFVKPGFKKEFAGELEAFSQTKSAVHFPKGKTIPADLITKIARHIAKENRTKWESKQAGARKKQSIRGSSKKPSADKS